MDRRTFIKAAGVAGGAAWVAPAIVDSLASPAAAITGTPGCFKFTVAATAGPTCTTVTSAFDATCDVTTSQCTPTTEAAGTSLSKYCMTGSTCSATTTTVTFTISAGCGCTILAARGRTNNNVACGGQCLNGVIAAGGKSVSFTKPGGACQWVGFNLLVQCT
jgi:hypothetical protein